MIGDGLSKAAGTISLFFCRILDVFDPATE
jgi:hypothetical protein